MQPRSIFRQNQRATVRSPLPRFLSAFLLGLLFFILPAVVFAPGARAITAEEHLVTFGSYGSAAGQFTYMLYGGIATDSADGHIFIGDAANHRIDEFTPWGEFVKAFGWDVAPGGVNEQQQVTVKATAGEFRLRFEGGTTADLPHNASAGEVEGALDALSSIGAAGVTVTRGPSDAASTRLLVAFTGATLKERDLETLGAEDGTAPLSGGTPTPSVSAVTVADGHPTATGLESCTAESGCQEGSYGAGAGQMNFGSVAVDAAGDIYLVEGEPQYRVQKFDSAGRFLLMFGDEVNKTTHGNVCTAASGDECGAGIAGAGPGQLEGIGIAVSAAGRVLVGQKERVEEFGPDGTFLSEVSLAGKALRDFAFDPVDGTYFAREVAGLSYNQRHVFKFSSAGTKLCEFPISTEETHGPGTLAVGPDGHLFVFREGGAGGDIVEFNGGCPASAVSEFALPSSRFNTYAMGTNALGDLLVGRVNYNNAPPASQLEIYGPPPTQYEPPLAVPPTITAQYAAAVDAGDASLRANVNPHFWTDTRYYVEYGTGKCSEGECEALQPTPPGSLLSSRASGSPVLSSKVLLSGLRPGTVYHYRFVARSGGGGPVYGVDPDGEGPAAASPARGLEGAFRTPPANPTGSSCPNQAFRTGYSAKLPDCRAYEMVSPVDKAGADVSSTLDVSSYTDTLFQSALDGERLTFSAASAFPGSVGGGIPNQYLSTRGSAGWSTQAISPPRQLLHEGNLYLENEYQAFSPDLLSAWLHLSSEAPLAPGPAQASSVLYHRDNTSSSYEALASTPDDEFPEPVVTLQGRSDDGSRAVFTIARKLTPDGTAGKRQLYYSDSSGLHLVCVLPSGVALTESCAAGGSPDRCCSDATRLAALTYAMSADGNRVYWSTAGERTLGKIYLRLNPGEPQSPIGEAGECEVSSAGCTLAVTSKAARFWAASKSGDKAIFTIAEGAKAGNLEEFDLETEATTLIAKKVVGVAGQSEDLSTVYFVSKEAIGGSNSEGSVPAAGAPNLYVESEGVDTFIATLTAIDVHEEGEGGDPGSPSDTAPQPIFHVARATPDGGQLAFISAAELTGYDNTDQATGSPDSEVYLFDRATGKLLCASCNPSGARPLGRNTGEEGEFSHNLAATDVAASIPAAYNQLTMPHVLSADGSRLFFDSYDALVPSDVNGSEDVYEWEESGATGCSQADASYSPENEGCVSLISSGENPSDSVLVDSSADGRDVFFTTAASLLPQDPGLIDVYDAREDGGLPPPLARPAVCEGEACQGPYNPPNDPTPASASFQGPGNVPGAKRLKKQKRKKAGNHRKHKGKKKVRAKHHGRAGR